MKRIALLAAAGALALATGTPAGAATTSPAGVVTASDGGTSGSCAYTRTSPMEWGDLVTIQGAATSLPDGSVWITCTVVTRAGEASVSGSGNLFAEASGSAVLPDGPTTVCIELWAQHTIDVQDSAYSCRRF